MKKQETVSTNFEKTLEQWELSRQKKITNLKGQQMAIINKQSILDEQITKISAEIDRIQQLEGPKPPNLEQRQSQRETSRFAIKK